MRTSLNEIKDIDDYLAGRLPQEEELAFSKRILTEPLVGFHVRMQKQVYRLVRIYGRRTLRAEIRSVEKKVFEDPANGSFQQQILNLFIR